jgi:hypothetical protein
MVIGAAGELPKPPEKKTVFLEGMQASQLLSFSVYRCRSSDMDDSELAEAVSFSLSKH